ncbi:hypothetical protein D9M73_111450 [compost metagenome]
MRRDRPIADLRVAGVGIRHAGDRLEHPGRVGIGVRQAHADITRPMTSPEARLDEATCRAFFHLSACALIHDRAEAAAIGIERRLLAGRQGGDDRR